MLSWIQNVYNFIKALWIVWDILTHIPNTKQNFVDQCLMKALLELSYFNTSGYFIIPFDEWWSLSTHSPIKLERPYFKVYSAYGWYNMNWIIVAAALFSLWKRAFIIPSPGPNNDTIARLSSCSLIFVCY